MNGYSSLMPTMQCTYCGQPFKLDPEGRHFVAHRVANKLYCTPDCAESDAKFNDLMARRCTA